MTLPSTLLAIVVLFSGNVVVRGKDVAAPKRQTTQYTDVFLSLLTAEGHEVTVVERRQNNESLDSWKEFFAPTFPMALRFDTADRVIIRDNKFEEPFVVFVFQTPKAFKQSVATDFASFSIHGSLRSKFLHHYHAVADEDVFVILLVEQKPIPPELPPLLLKALDERRRAMRENAKPPPDPR